jgi:hypothetical protein
VKSIYQEKRTGTKRTVNKAQNINYKTLMIKPTPNQTKTIDKAKKKKKPRRRNFK